MSNNASAPTYGLEEELMVVDRDTQAPAVPDAACMTDLKTKLGERFALEYKATVVELVTGVHHRVFDLTEEVAANRYEASAILERHGYAALPLAIHPEATSLALAAQDGERYRRIERMKGDAVRQLAVNGMHLHIGTYYDEAERLRDVLPLIHLTAIHAAVTASSPFANGRDTGQASWRLRMLMQLAPVIPLTASCPKELNQLYQSIAASGGPRDASEQWGLVRLGVGKPTIEFRAADTMPSITDITWLAAITGAAVYAQRAGLLPPPTLSPSASFYLYAANLDNVAAKGAEAMIVDPFDLQAKTIQASIDAWIARLTPAIEALALDDAIALRPSTLGAPWRAMKTFADCIQMEGIACGLPEPEARSLAFRHTVERALTQIIEASAMPWLRHPSNC